MRISAGEFCFGFLLFLLIPGFTSAQHSYMQFTENLDTFRIGVKSGGSVQFKVNSINDYSQQITYNDWVTTLKIYCDTLTINGTLHEENLWRLEVRALEGEDSLQSSYPNRSLGLDNLTLEATNFRNLNGGPENVTLNSKSLSSSYEILIEDGD